MRNPFRRWRIFYGKTVRVAACDSPQKDKEVADYICDGLLPDDMFINAAIEALDSAIPDYELGRRREWCWPWQKDVVVTNLSSKQLILAEGSYEIASTINLGSGMHLILKGVLMWESTKSPSTTHQ